jgi:LytTr DNA-binding domain-containing protein
MHNSISYKTDGLFDHEVLGDVPTELLLGCADQFGELQLCDFLFRLAVFNQAIPDEEFNRRDQRRELLLKVRWVGRERFRRMLDRVRRRLSGGVDGPPSSERARTTLGDGPLRRLFARRGERIVPIPMAGILHIRARGDYAEVHAPDGPFLLHVSLSELAARLDPERFIQVHRSHIVNLEAVKLLPPL